jgi:hypothetical protein
MRRAGSAINSRIDAQVSTRQCRASAHRMASRNCARVLAAAMQHGMIGALGRYADVAGQVRTNSSRIFLAPNAVSRA